MSEIDKAIEKVKWFQKSNNLPSYDLLLALLEERRAFEAVGTASGAIKKHTKTCAERDAAITRFVQDS